MVLHSHKDICETHQATRTADYLRSLGSPLTEPLPSGCMEEDGAILVTKDTGAIEGGFMACVTAWLANKSITICPVVEDEFQQHGRPSPDHGTALFKISFLPALF